MWSQNQSERMLSEERKLKRNLNCPLDLVIRRSLVPTKMFLTLIGNCSATEIVRVEK